MRPRLRSYGDSSTRTLSPGTTRMKFIRIFPEMCARTEWPFWSSTLNIALGRASETVPSTSMTSLLLGLLAAMRLRRHLADVLLSSAVQLALQSKEVRGCLPLHVRKRLAAPTTFRRLECECVLDLIALDAHERSDVGQERTGVLRGRVPDEAESPIPRPRPLGGRNRPAP